MKVRDGIVLALVALLPRLGQAQVQRHTPRQAGHLGDLIGAWIGPQILANGTPDTILWHLVIEPDTTYLWKTHADFRGTGREQERPQLRLALRGDTLTLAPDQSYTVQLKRQNQELWLTERAAAGGGKVFRLERDWLSTIVTGRPLECKNGVLQTFACANIELLAYLPNNAIEETAGYDLWGWHDSAASREFLIVGGNSTGFIEVTDPVRPRYLGVLPPQDSATRASHTAQSVKVYQHYAFIGYEGASHGLQIFDLTQLRDVKQPTTFRETAHYDGFKNTHTIAVNPETGFLYANWTNTCGGGLHMIDVRTPAKPVFAGCYTEPRQGGGGIHDTQCVTYRGPDQQYQGREICINYAFSGITIADVTDKQHSRTISSATYPNAMATHQGWFTEDQRYVFLNDELDETISIQQVGIERAHSRTIGFDLQDLDDPVVLVEYYNPNSRSTDHNLYIRGRYMYQANNSAGLRVIDIIDPKAPKEVGYLSPKHNDASDKRYRANPADLATWAGPRAWAPYPYFKNGVVAVSLTSGVILARLLKP